MASLWSSKWLPWNTSTVSLSHSVMVAMVTIISSTVYINSWLITQQHRSTWKTYDWLMCSGNRNCLFPRIRLPVSQAVYMAFPSLISSWQKHVDLRGPISGETGYVIVWFSRCHPQESVLWELMKTECESPGVWDLSTQPASCKV